jgi:RNA polymerase sigma factor for flagellar operon FliA
MTATLRVQAVNPNLTDALWIRYRATGDADARAQLLDRYIGLVYHVAREIGARTPAVEVDELVSAGTLGLIRALESFDLSRGLAFSTYAVRRIRGAMLDDLRSRDWTPRSIRVKNRRLATVVAELQGRLGRAPRPREVAQELGLSLETYWEWRHGAEGGVMVSFEGGAPDGAPQTSTLEEVIGNPEAPLPGQELMVTEQADGLKAAIARLPEKERTVLALYYYEELNLRQIAEVLHVTESRVSQIRSQALRRLRDRLGDREQL